MHRCMWPGCDVPVCRSMWGCRAHWYALPNNLRSWIGRAYRQGIERGDHPSRSWRNAHATALEWIRQREVPVQPQPPEGFDRSDLSAGYYASPETDCAGELAGLENRVRAIAETPHHPRSKP